jgi:hypothetical protein
MQEMADGDNNRTPAIFWVPDNLVFVGEINGNLVEISPVISKSNLRLQPQPSNHYIWVCHDVFDWYGGLIKAGRYSRIGIILEFVHRHTDPYRDNIS